MNCTECKRAVLTHGEDGRAWLHCQENDMLVNRRMHCDHFVASNDMVVAQAKMLATERLNKPEILM